MTDPTLIGVQGSFRPRSAVVAGALFAWLALGPAPGAPHVPSHLPPYAPPAAAAPTGRAQEETLARLDSLDAAGSLDSLLSILGDALPTARGTADSVFVMNLLVRQGRGLASVGRGMEAEPPLREALQLAEALPNTGAQCVALRWLGLALGHQGRLDDARECWQRLLSLSLSIADREHEGWAWAGMGFSDWHAGHPDLALPAYERAVTLFAEQGQPRGQAVALCGLGCVYGDLGRRSEAIDCFQRTIEIGRRNGWPGTEAIGANDLACLLYAGGDPGEAQKYFQRAHELQVLIGNHREALIAGANQALCQGFLGRYAEALQILTPLAEECRRYGILELEGTILNLTAEIRLLEGRPHLAAELYRSLLARSESLTSDQRMESLMGLSRALSEADSNQSALAVLQRWAPWVETLNPGLVATRFRIELGRRQLDVGQAREALETLAYAQVHATRLAQPGLRLRALALLARGYRALGLPDTALALLREAATLWDQERGLPADPQWREARGAITRDLRTQLGLLLLNYPVQSVPQQRIWAAFDALQVFKARTLHERMQGPGVGDFEAAGFRAATCRELQEQVLGPGELLLDFHLGVDSSLVFAVWRSGVRAIRLPPSPVLEPALRFYREQLSTPPAKTWSDKEQRILAIACRETSELLLGGLLDLIEQATTLIVSPDGEVNPIPFSALLASRSDGADARAGPPSPPSAGARAGPGAGRLPVIQSVPSAAILAQLRRNLERPLAAGAGPGSILALAGATSGTGQRLCGALSEVEDLAARFDNVARALPPRTGDSGSGDHTGGVADQAQSTGVAAPSAAAGVDSALAGLLGQLETFDVLHFAAHSEVDDQHPWRSAIDFGSLTATGARLRLPAHRIAGHRLAARLVVLSGCESAGGRVLAGEGVIGLSSAFLSAGVPTVLATLWAVEDRSTARFMRAFYASLAGGSTPAQALADAQGTPAPGAADGPSILLGRVRPGGRRQHPVRAAGEGGSVREPFPAPPGSGGDGLCGGPFGVSETHCARGCDSMTGRVYHRRMPEPEPAAGSDEALALLAARSAGSPEGRRAATELLGRYRLTVYRWCLRHVRDPEQAMDLTQEVLLRVYRQMEIFDGRARFATWLFVITRNLCRSALRKPRLLRDEGVEPDTLADPDGGPYRRLEEEESEEALLELIRVHLDRREQDALWLRCVERMPLEVITRVLAIEEKSGARAVLQSARRKLRAALAARDQDAGGCTRE